VARRRSVIDKQNEHIADVCLLSNASVRVSDSFKRPSNFSFYENGNTAKSTAELHENLTNTYRSFGYFEVLNFPNDRHISAAQ